MKTYHGGRSFRSTGLFSFGLLDGRQTIAVSTNDRLTKTRPAHHLAGVHTRDAPYSPRRGPRRRAQTWRALFIAPCALREAYEKGRVPLAKTLSWQAQGGWVKKRQGWAGEIKGFGLNRLPTAFRNNPG
jgi:hypothetical protein